MEFSNANVQQICVLQAVLHDCQRHKAENLIICTCIQSFDSVDPHLELVYLESLRLLNMRNQVLLNILTFFSAEFSSSLQDLHFHQVMGMMLQRQVIY